MSITLPVNALYLVDNTCPGIVYWFPADRAGEVAAYAEGNGQDIYFITQEKAEKYLTVGHPGVPSEGVWSLAKLFQE